MPSKVFACFLVERIIGDSVDGKVECIHVGTGRVGLGVVVDVCTGNGVCLPIPVVVIAGSHMVGSIIVLGN